MHDLSERIAMPLFAAVGILEAIWHYSGDFAPRGDVGRASNAAISRAIDWRKKPELLVDSLVDAKWLDRSEEHRLIVHDWPDHAQEWVKKKLMRSKPRQDWLPVYGKSLYSVEPMSRQNQDIVSPRARQGSGLGSGEGSSEEKKDGEIVRPDWDEQFKNLKTLYAKAAIEPLIQRDWDDAWYPWSILDFEQKKEVVDSVYARITAGQQILHKPGNYIRKEECKRPVRSVGSGKVRSVMDGV